MERKIYLPGSSRSAAKQIRQAFGQRIDTLPPREFVRAWCAIAYLFPGLHPDEFENPEGGWPKVLKRFAAEAFRRAAAGGLDDAQLYPYSVIKLRLLRETSPERLELSKKPWYFSDHFST
jgi:hypothetical protein